MSNTRKQQALTIRAEGQRDAQVIRSQADTQAGKIFADALNQDPEFYNFWRAMQSYRYSFGVDSNGKLPSGSTTMILTPDNSYLKEFEGNGK
jgi:membrane protease subunit HflC